MVATRAINASKMAFDFNVIWAASITPGRGGDVSIGVVLVAALSYFTPLLSTLLLILAGRAPLSWVVAVACLLITGGALLAAGWPRRRPGSS